MYRQLRYDEDYSFLRYPENRTDYLDGLKFIPLKKDSHSYLSLGGEARLFYEHYQNENWGATEVEKNDYFLQRYMMHADLKLGRHVRLFAQLKSGLINGRAGGPRPADVDKLDVNQAFVDFSFSFGKNNSGIPVTLRLGRQELDLGAGRMISVRELPNVRLAFDGLRTSLYKGKWKMDAFAVRPSETNEGFFDDSTDKGNDLWGLYSTTQLDDRHHIDLFYMGNQREIAPYTNGVAGENRHSFGTRLWSSQDRVSWDIEGVYQTGSFGSGTISAWSFSSRVNYSLTNEGVRPKIGLNAGANSGDKNVEDEINNTFFPPSPNGAYFGAVGSLGPSNLSGFAPKLSISPTRKIFVDTYYYFFWRQSNEDGIYNVPGFPNKGANTSKEKFIGSQGEIDVIWQIASHQTLVFILASFFNGKFIQETPPSEHISYMAIWYTFKF